MEKLLIFRLENSESTNRVLCPVHLYVGETLIFI